MGAGESREDKLRHIVDELDEAIKRSDGPLLLHAKTLIDDFLDEYGKEFAPPGGKLGKQEAGQHERMRDIVDDLSRVLELEDLPDEDWSHVFAQLEDARDISNFLLVNSRSLGVGKSYLKANPEAAQQYFLAAAASGQLHVVRGTLPLVDPSADSNAAVISAIENGHYETALFLLEDERVTVKTSLVTALDRAIKADAKAVIEILISKPIINSMLGFIIPQALYGMSFPPGTPPSEIKPLGIGYKVVGNVSEVLITHEDYFEFHAILKPAVGQTVSSSFQIISLEKFDEIPNARETVAVILKAYEEQYGSQEDMTVDVEHK